MTREREPVRGVQTRSAALGGRTVPMFLCRNGDLPILALGKTFESPRRRLCQNSCAGFRVRKFRETARKPVEEPLCRQFLPLQEIPPYIVQRLDIPGDFDAM